VPDREEQLGVGVPARGAMAEVAHNIALISMVIPARRGGLPSAASAREGVPPSVEDRQVRRRAEVRGWAAV
jgi:hypothetical protein